MEFFVPEAESPERAVEAWEATRKFAQDTLGWEVGDRRIFRLDYRHGGKSMVAEVGKPDPFIGEEPIMAILESNAFLVCTPNRGVLRGMPILVGIEEILKVTDFDSPVQAS